MRRALAMVLALVLCIGFFPVNAYAAEEETETVIPVGGGTVEIPSVPGGTQTETVDITVSTDENGKIVATATVEGGDTTASGATVTYESEVVTDETGTVTTEKSSYEVVSEDGNYTASGGTEITTEILPQEEPLKPVDVHLVNEKGEIAKEAVGGDTSVPEFKPTNAGDSLQSEDPANFDQTAVLTTDRKVEVQIQESTVVSGDPGFVNEDGEIIYYDENGNVLESEPDRNGYDWVHTGHRGELGSTGRWYAVSYDENGNEVKRYLDKGRADERRVKNTETGAVERELYCVDSSTDFIAPYVGYRLVNLEDAVEDGYYTEEEAAHLRAIMNNGYNWGGNAELEEMKTALSSEQADNELLAGLDIAALSETDVAVATAMAVWHYGNRFELEQGEELKLELDGDAAANAAAMQLYRYLISLKEEEQEDQVINEEKFVDDLVFTVGDKAEGEANNQDNDHTNDVYNTTLKFSMVVTPDKKSDDLIVKVLNEKGEVVKQARIAGEQKEGETFGYAETVEENGKTYYVLRDMQLTENTNTAFNLKLEGTQLLKEGVYVFESEQYGDEEALDKIAKAAKFGTGEDYKNAILAECLAAGMTEEEALAEVMKEIERINAGQNFIGRFSGTADVDVGVRIDLTFNVDEASQTTVRTWRVEKITVEQTPDPEPRKGKGRTLPVQNYEVMMVDEADIEVKAQEDATGNLTIIDEEVPLANVPQTGDASILWAFMGLLSLAGSCLLSPKKKEEK